MSNEARKGPLLLLCHSGGWDRAYQALTAAVSATSMGRDVTLVFYFGALRRLVGPELDDFDLEPRQPEREAQLEQRADEIGTPRLSELLEAGRRSGRLRLLACSASAALEGCDEASLQNTMDEVVGWPTVLSIMERAGQVLYL